MSWLRRIQRIPLSRTPIAKNELTVPVTGRLHLRPSATPPSMAVASPLLEAAEGVRSGAVSAEELVTKALKRLDETEGDVGAFLSVQGSAAMEAARQIDRKVWWSGQEPRGPGGGDGVR